jgi:hypothetical protein
LHLRSDPLIRGAQLHGGERRPHLQIKNLKGEIPAIRPADLSFTLVCAAHKSYARNEIKKLKVTEVDE